MIKTSNVRRGDLTSDVGGFSKKIEKKNSIY